MKALTVRQPWAWAIMHGGKRVENRTWQTKYRGRIAIHAAASADRNAHNRVIVERRTAHGPDADLPRGVLLGTVEIVDCHPAETNHLCSPWAFPDGWHWVLARPEVFASPVPAVGAQGLWNVPEDIAAVLA